MALRTLVIVNPSSGGGSTARRWRRLEPRVREVLGSVEVETTREPRAAERLAREGVRAGVERIVVAGGDGTLAEVATGLLEADLGNYVELGILPMGTGCDFARSLGLPRRPEAALEVLAVGQSRRFDAGRAHYTGPDGKPFSSHFVNVASFGVSARTVELAERLPRWLGAGAAFGLGAAAALLSQRPHEVVLRVDDREVFSDRSVLVAIANGRWFGGGMQVAPDACPDDGRFQVVGVEGIAATRLVAKLPKLYRGTHLSDPVTRSWNGAAIEASCSDGPLGLELDGDLRGSLPVRVEMLTSALAWIVPPR